MDPSQSQRSQGGDLSPHDPYAALRLGDFRFFMAGNVAAVFGGQMVSVAIGWELYQLTDSATALGLVGLFQLIPLLLLAIPAGQLVDQADRKRVVIVSQIVLTFTALVLGLVSLWHTSIPHYALFEQANHALLWTARLFREKHPHFDDPFVPLLFAVIFVQGAIRAFNQPAKSAMMPMIIPAGIFPNAVTWHSSAQETCSMVGPALGGAIIAIMLKQPKWAPFAFSTVYLLNAGLQFGQSLLLLPIHVIRPPRPHEKMTLHSLTAGIRYVADDTVLLAALTLDLLAVILGGATALLPIFARDILHVGPSGLGWLRAAPSLGAVAMATLIAHLPPMKKAGRNLLLGVIGFGLATIVFAVSTNFVLSLLMLALTGAFDNISVVIRHTLVQLRTPERMRGRVSAVNAIFIGSSNQLGALESGLTAAAFGTVPSTLLGGVGTILVVIAVAMAWPEIRQLGAIHHDIPQES